jgi:hypothetical protein
MRGEQLGLRESQGRERATMREAGAEATQGIEMLRGGVTLVDGETVAGVELVQLGHEAISQDLGDDAGGGNGETSTVTLDDSGLGELQRVHEEAVDQYMNRGRVQAGKGAVHGRVCGAQDVDRVDQQGIHLSDGELNLMLEESFEEDFSLSRSELFGVIQPLQVPRQPVANPAERENDGGCHHRPSQRPAPGFIHSRQRIAATIDESTFELESIDNGKVWHATRVPVAGAPCQAKWGAELDRMRQVGIRPGR